ncbi:MAG: alpha/beta fold hydrolase [Gemmatimonadaceae bacterium]
MHPPTRLHGPMLVRTALLRGALILGATATTAAAQTPTPPAASALPRQGYVVADDGARLYYHVVGAGRPVVIVRGALFLERDLEAVRRQLRAERFVAVGWSYLRMMVMRYAAAHPERIARVVQIGPVGREFGTRYPDSLTARDAVPVPESASLAELARLRTDGLAARDPRARLLTVPGAAHMPWLDAPEVVYPAIERFLRGEWPRGAVPVPVPVPG